MTDQAAIEERAAVWLLRMTDAGLTDDTECEFKSWLNESYAHAAAYWRLEQGYSQLDYLASLPPVPVESRRRWFAPRIPGLLAMTATILALVCGVWLLSGSGTGGIWTEPTSYSTQLGEISRIELVDGTEVSLDSDSTIRVTIDDGDRKLWLDRGRAYLHVSHDPDRPFHVYAGVGKITVLGTRFAVARQKRTVEIAVVDGSVRIARSASDEKTSLVLTKGNVGTIDAKSVRARTGDLSEIQDSLAWREGMVVFLDTPITQAIAQLNRYNRRKLVIRGDGASAMLIGGSFRVGNIDGFARLVEHAYGLKIDIVEPVR